MDPSPASFASRFAADLGWVGALAIAFIAVERLLHFPLSGRFPGYEAFDGRRRRQVRVRVFEAIASTYLSLGGILGAAAHVAWRENFIYGSSAFERGHATALAAFYGYHFVRMARAGGYAKALFPHHAIMFLGLLCCLYYDVLYFYVMLSAVPAAAAAVRNVRWAARISAGAIPALSPGLAAALSLLLELPAPIGGFVHLYAVGLADGRIPGPAWALVIGPAVASTLMAAWFVARGFRDARRPPLGSADTLAPAVHRAP